MQDHRTVDADVADGFARAVRGARDSRRLTQEAYAELCDVSAETVQRYERPTYAGHSIATVQRLLAGFAEAARREKTLQSHPLTETERAPFDTMLRALGQHGGAVDGVYQTQREAYERIGEYLRTRFHDVGPIVRSAVLIQTSGVSSLPLLTTILECLIKDQSDGSTDDAPVVMYTADARVLASLGSTQQEKRIRALQDELPNALQDGMRHLAVRAYRTPPSFGAVHIEFMDEPPILLLGFIAYTQKVGAGDYLELSAHNRAAIVALGGTPQYQSLYPTLQGWLSNLEVVARPQGTAWYSEDMPPATVAYYRLRSLLRAAYSVEDAAFIGLWTGMDLASVTDLLAATRAYYAGEEHRDDEMVAYLDLALGLAYRDLGAESDNVRNYEQAGESLNNSLKFWTKKPDAALARAYCYDRLGTLSHVLGERDRAAQYYEDADDWARRARIGENEMPARVVGAWARLNWAMLELDCGHIESARDYIASSLDDFEASSEHGALLTCVAATACYAHALGLHETAIELIGSLAKEGARRMNPTWWHQWVVKALRASRRAIGDHHSATEAERTGEAWSLTESLRVVHGLVGRPVATTPET
ncbi:MAG: helix-turn-helix domain-containing protein [Chloroflexota bacterium]|nr:helix-turn-helix domain-containing protein [Chloroflexota bacterium]